MIFHFYFALSISGYYSVSTLLGSYMILYAGANEMDFSLLFMIQPVTIFARPLICAMADRRQNHRQMLAFFALLAAFSYIPYAIMPFVIDPNDSRAIGNQRFRYWTMVGFHILGSLGFCGVRSLGDATAINFAKRFGTDYARYRKFGSISYGICAYLIGLINQRGLLPDFVPGILMHIFCMLSLGLLAYAWPNEYFKMMINERAAVAKMSQEEVELENSKLPTARETATHVLKSLLCMQPKEKHATPSSHGYPLELGVSPKADLAHDRPAFDSCKMQEQKNLTLKQQAGIFRLLMQRDFRLALYLLVIFYNGLVAYSGPNFVFTYLNETCRRKGTCDGAKLAGIVMISYCAVETIGYVIIDKLRGRLNRVLMLELTFVSVAVHYFFYGYLLDSLSPWWFLVESLHGVEYSIGLSTSVELGYYFAKEVELLIPELIKRRIIGEHDDLDRVRVALMATLSGCFTFMYDGIGCIVGVLVFGLTTGLYSYNVTWILIGAMSTVGFFVMLIFWLVGKIFHIRPQILALRDASSNK